MAWGRPFVLASLLLSLSGCCGAQAETASSEPRLPFDRPPPRMLRLGEEASGDTSVPDGRASSSCKSGGRAGQALDHLYGFEVKETATYRFALLPSFDGVIQVQEHHPEKPWFFGVGCAAAGPNKKAVVSATLTPGLYWVVVDGNLWDENGPYKLNVALDRSEKAEIGQEDPKKLAKLYAEAPRLQVGERHYGIYRSSPGEARTSCGLLNGNGVQQLSLDHKTKLKLRAAAHFPFSIELRQSTKEGKPICVRTAPGHYDAEIVADLEPGEYFVVLDSLLLPERDPYSSNNSTLRQKGAYLLDTEEVAP